MTHKVPEICLRAYLGVLFPLLALSLSSNQRSFVIFLFFFLCLAYQFRFLARFLIYLNRIANKLALDVLLHRLCKANSIEWGYVFESLLGKFELFGFDQVARSFSD